MGGAKLEADALAAIIADGSLNVAGQPDPVTGNPQGSSFNGLLYSKGDLTLTNTRTIGTIISASNAAGVPGKLIVEDSTVISTPNTSDFRLVIKKFAPQTGGGLGGIDAGGGGSGPGWEILEPNPADLLVQNPDGSESFAWNPSSLKIRIKQAGDGSWRVISNPAEATAAGLASGGFDSLEIAYDRFLDTWDKRVTKLNEENGKELVEILDFDLNEFLKVSSRLQAKRVFYLD